MEAVVRYSLSDPLVGALNDAEDYLGTKTRYFRSHPLLPGSESACGEWMSRVSADTIGETQSGARLTGATPTIPKMRFVLATNLRVRNVADCEAATRCGQTRLLANATEPIACGRD